MITSSVEIVLASLGFMLSASAIKFQDQFNAAVEQGGIESKLSVTVASVTCAFFFLGILTASAGVHGYRSRNRWFYLGHLVFAMFLSLCYFAIFIDGIIQFKKMKLHILENLTTASPAAQNSTETPAVEQEHKLEKSDVTEVINRLGFPFAICFVHIVLYLVSGRYAWKAWKDSTSPTIQREILEEEPEEKQDPIS